MARIHHQNLEEPEDWIHRVLKLAEVTINMRYLDYMQGSFSV